MGLIGHFAQQQEVVATEGLGGLPLVTVLVETAEGGVETHPRFGFVPPDSGFDLAEPDFVDGFGLQVWQTGVLHQVHRFSFENAGIAPGGISFSGFNTMFEILKQGGGLIFLRRKERGESSGVSQSSVRSAYRTRVSSSSGPCARLTAASFS